MRDRGCSGGFKEFQTGSTLCVPVQKCFWEFQELQGRSKEFQKVFQRCTKGSQGVQGVPGGL